MSITKDLQKCINMLDTLTKRENGDLSEGVGNIIQHLRLITERVDGLENTSLQWGKVPCKEETL